MRVSTLFSVVLIYSTENGGCMHTILNNCLTNGIANHSIVLFSKKRDIYFFNAVSICRLAGFSFM